MTGQYQTRTVVLHLVHRPDFTHEPVFYTQYAVPPLYLPETYDSGPCKSLQ